MTSWVITNKEWFFSGAGIFIISCIISLISIIGTLAFKSKAEKRKMKKLNIDFNIKKIFLPGTADDTYEEKQFSQNLNVSYKNKAYENLCYIMIDIRNTGLIAIENQSVLINFPEETVFVEKYEKFCNSTIKVISEKEEIHEKNIEIVIKINRLETNDNVQFTYLIDASDSGLINVNPRGVDNIEYSYDNASKKNIDNYEKLLLIIGLYIIFDTIPFFGGYLKALVIVFNFPTLKAIIMKLLQKKQNSSQNIIIKENSNMKVNINNHAS